MKRCKVVLALLVVAATIGTAQTVYHIPPHSNGNQIELSISNKSTTQVAELVEVRATKYSPAVTFSSSVEHLAAIAPNGEATVTFTFDVGRPKALTRNDTLEFQISDRSGAVWVKRIMLNYSAPEVFRLEQNFPNPFNPTTTIEYQLPTESRVSLKVYDLLGREAMTLVNEQQGAGYRETTFNAGQIASGVYFYRIVAQPMNGGPAFSQLRKLMVLK